MESYKFKRTEKSEPSLYYADVDENLEPGITYGPVVRDCYIIECCTGGYGSLVIGSKEFKLSRGICAIAPPGIPVMHTADKTEPRSGVWCAIDGIKVRSILLKAGITEDSPYTPAEAFGEITGIVRQLVDTRMDNDAGAELRRTSLIYGILGAIMRYSSTSDTDSIIDRAIGFMETEHHRPISVSEIAAAVGFERSYFSTLFKRKTGLSPHAYLENLRIRKSCELMCEDGYSSAEAAFAVGIDPVNFSRTFKRVYGKSPKEFIREIREK